MTGRGDEMPADPWRPPGHPFAVALDEARAVGDLVSGIDSVEGITAAVFALLEAEVRMVVLERALRDLAERRGR